MEKSSGLETGNDGEEDKSNDVFFCTMYLCREVGRQIERQIDRLVDEQANEYCKKIDR